MKKYYYIYKISNLINNKIYIGAHSTNNLSDGYFGSGKLLKKDLKKYGIDNFKKEIITKCNSLTEMYEIESDIVDDQFIARLDTYNIRLGGKGGFEHINNHEKSKIWKIKAGKIAGKITQNKLRIDESLKKEVCIKISNSLKLYYENNNNPFKNKKHTQESKYKIGKVNSIYQKGTGNSQYGTCWIYNNELKKCKKIKKEDLLIWINKGWSKGRKMSFIK